MTSTSPTGGALTAAGYDPTFLATVAPLRLPSLSSTPTLLLTYTHFSVLMRPDRKLATATGVNIDGATLQDLDRAGIEWRYDPRLPIDQQTGPAVYAGNDLDRGHLVRRRDPCWGPVTVAQQANVDTFHFTNAAPQAAAFNQGDQLWAGLEDYLLDNAATYDRKLSVFTGPVLAETDPLYRGTRIPLRFWKIAAFVDDGQLAATGYLLDQTPLVNLTETPARAPPASHHRSARSAPSRSPSQTSPSSPA
jgi:endonuclease G